MTNYPTDVKQKILPTIRTWSCRWSRWGSGFGASASNRRSSSPPPPTTSRSVRSACTSPLPTGQKQTSAPRSARGPSRRRTSKSTARRASSLFRQSFSTRRWPYTGAGTREARTPSKRRWGQRGSLKFPKFRSSVVCGASAPAYCYMRYFLFSHTSLKLALRSLQGTWINKNNDAQFSWMCCGIKKSLNFEVSYLFWTVLACKFLYACTLKTLSHKFRTNCFACI